MEPELWPWCVIEYKHISKIVGQNNLWFTNIKPQDVKTLEPYGKVSTQSIKALQLKEACILDPESPDLLTPNNSKQYQYFIFGGILGDHPPKKRTQEELTPFLPNVPAFNIGKEQMSTDNAVYVTKQITEGKNLSDLLFQDEVEIEINEIESTILPYRYTLVNGKPLMSEELIKFLKKQ